MRNTDGTQLSTTGDTFTDQGYIYNNKNTFTEWYNGRESDIPKGV